MLRFFSKIVTLPGVQLSDYGFVKWKVSVNTERVSSEVACTTYITLLPSRNQC